LALPGRLEGLCLLAKVLVLPQEVEAFPGESRWLSRSDAVQQVSLPEKARKELLGRLRRIEGQARGVQRMVEDQRHCSEVINQLASIRAATYSASLFLLKQHARACWSDPGDGQHPEETLEDLVELMLRLAD